MSQPSDALFRELGKNAAVVGYLDRYLAALEPEEEKKLYSVAEAALFDEAQLQAARVQFGRLEMVRQLRRNLAPYIIEQYTR